VVWTEVWAEGPELRVLLERDLCCPLIHFALLLVVFGTEGRDLLLAEESEWDSSAVSGGGVEAGKYCASEDTPASQLSNVLAEATSAV
jgi:hypothetical protein